jgi:hypothetical protein
MSHPLLNAFWIMLWFFLWILWLFLLFRVFADIFSDDSLSGWGKTGWVIFVLILPFLGVFIYLIVRGKSMGERAQKKAEEHQAAFQDYVREAAKPTEASKADELSKLAALKADGTLNDEEFNRAKEKVLAG